MRNKKNSEKIRFDVIHSFIGIIPNLLVGAIYAAVIFYVSPPVSATSSCTVSVSPSDNAPLSSVNFNVLLNNSGTESINWIKITRPSSSYYVTGLTQEGWDGSISSNSGTMSGASVEVGSNFNFSVTAYTFEVPTANEGWLVEVSSSPVGESPVACTGSTATKISPPGAFSGEGYFNLEVSNVTGSSATISWQTYSPATGIVYYGTSESYSNYTKHGGVESVNHVVQLSGLSPQTSYDFQIAGSSAVDYLALSTQQSFSTGTASTVDNDPKQNDQLQADQDSAENTPQVNGDNVVPVISFESDLSNPFSTAVALKGKSSDDIGLYSIDYSLDGGQNWLPVASSIGSLEFEFEFIPAANKDGNYKLMLRARDIAGNQGFTDIRTLVIDSLPPVVGSVMVSVGPLILHPDEARSIVVAANVDLTFTAGVIGGATDVSVVLVPLESNADVEVFDLTLSPSTGLWQGIVRVKEPGDYKVEIKSIDGAKTKLVKQVADLRVESSVNVVDSKTDKFVEDSRIGVFKLNTETNRWGIWDGESYGQEIDADKNGKEVGVYLPSGKYYIRVEAEGYHGVNSTTFTIDKPTIISHTFELHKSRKISFLLFDVTIPRFGSKNPDIELSGKESNQTNGYGISKVPLFELEGGDGEIVSSSSFFGKPTIFIFVNTWSSESIDMLRILNEIGNEDINVIAIFSGESASRVNSFAAISGLSITMLADTNNSLSEPFNIAGPTTSYFVSRSGEVTKVSSGLLSKKEVINNVSP